MAKQRILYFDILNILAAFAVVFLHTNSMVHSFSDTMAWRQALIVEVFLYWAVPVFFMLSGANLMSYRERYTTVEFFKKRFVRILIPFVLWTFIYAFIYKINPLEIGIREFFNRCFNTQIITTFWFFIPMLSIYLAMPIVSLLKDNKKILWYMVALSFVLSALMPQVFRYLGLTWNHSLKDLTTGGFLIYTILGYLLAKTDFSLRKRTIIYVIGILAALLRYFSTLFLSVRDDALNNMFFDYAQYHAVLLATAVFVFFKNSRFISFMATKPRLITFLKNLSGLSFGVYLVHYIVIFVLQDYVNVNTYIWRLGMPLLIYAISAAVIFILKKIPIIKFLVP